MAQTVWSRRGKLQVVFAAAALVAFGVLIGSGCSDDSPDEPAGASDELVLARENAGGGDIRVLSSGAHTVYHLDQPLPSVETPRTDGRPTLVWFSATWCTTCKSMEPFAHKTANGFAEEVVFVEKAIDEEPDTAADYRVLGPPTFVLIDSTGEEIGRFGYQRDAASFEAAIRASLDG